MASKLNRKFIFVVGGFSLAAVLLLVAVILVNQLWLKNADRHIRAGDELMAQGKAREAYAMYGRAVGKKPDVVRYIEKMEEALGKVTADTPACSRPSSETPRRSTPTNTEVSTSAFTARRRPHAERRQHLARGSHRLEECGRAIRRE